ncbi:aminopeptidase P family protein, partial [Candidatus Peregrinibacteria bacterium]|nr:aminopeptidase P family protein [Candidatus Peregrinibacteria bacterium]
KTKNYFITDARYKQEAKKLKGKLKFELIIQDKNFKELFQKGLKKHRVKHMYFEAEDMTISRLKSFKKLFEKGIKFKETESEIAKNMRVQKNRSEILKTRKAQQIIEKVFKQIKKELKPKQTEKNVAWRIKELCQKYGAEDISFKPIVAFGPNSASPHHTPTDHKLRKGEPVLIDMGARYQGYCSDMTRMIFTNKPTKEQTEVYNTVLKAQTAAIKAIAPGIKASSIAKIAKKIIEDAGYKESHSLGHGVGIEVHDPPTSLSIKSKDILREGMIVTIEPGIYLPGKFGVRIEDMGVVTRTGIKIFTKTPKKLSSNCKPSTSTISQVR